MTFASVHSPSTPVPPAPRRSAYLTFAVGAETYAIDAAEVEEIRAFERPTRVAGTPPFIRGVINLRGAIVPVVDLRLRFGAGEAHDSPFTVLVVLRLGGRRIGVVVDAVADVVELAPEAIGPAPAFAGALGADHVRGLATLAGEMAIVLDAERLMLAPDMALVDVAQAEAP